MSMHLVLFFTRGVSLRTWAMMGMLGREIAVYRRLISKGWKVSFVTYGSALDLNYQDQLGPIEVLCNNMDLAWEEYENNVERIHDSVLSRASLFKTNQLNGAEIALRAAQFFGKPLVARCGYMWSFNAEKEYGLDSAYTQSARDIEYNVFSQANKIVVTTERMKAGVLSRLPASDARVHVIPNYVDTDLFQPNKKEPDKQSLIFIGRIAPEKNLDSLLTALRALPNSLTIVGEGRLRPELQTKFQDLDERITWEGNVPNKELPDFLNSAEVFILPSLYEGHPKALLEAMSCARPVIGCDSPGIREIISHGHNGLLVSTKAEAIRSAIERLNANSKLKVELGQNARQYVLQHYSLDKIVEMERELLDSVLEST